jgi:hypothetical protein
LEVLEGFPVGTPVEEIKQASDASGLDFVFMTRIGALSAALTFCLLPIGTAQAELFGPHNRSWGWDEEFFRRAHDAKTDEERKRFSNRVRPVTMATYGSPHAPLSGDQAPEPDVPVQRCAHTHNCRAGTGEKIFTAAIRWARHETHPALALESPLTSEKLAP